MKTLELKDKTIYIPESWNDVTLKQQLTYERLYKSESDYKSLGIIAGYCDLKMDEVKRIPLNDTKYIFQHIDFISTPIQNMPVTEFEYKNEKYSVVQTLLKAETQDFVSIESLLENYKDKENLALPYIVAILAKKQNESLSDFDLELRAKHFEDLPITIANGIWFFFAATAKMYTIDFREVLASHNQSINQSISSILTTVKTRKSGGIYTRLQRAILRNYLKYLQRNWSKYYSGLNLDKERSS